MPLSLKPFARSCAAASDRETEAQAVVTSTSGRDRKLWAQAARLGAARQYACNGLAFPTGVDAKSPFRLVGGSWRCDEKYVKVKGRWTYLYRAVDKQGRTVDSLLSERRDVAAAKRFFRKAMENHTAPRVITLDAYAASHQAIRELQSAGKIARRVRIRSSRYLNNVVEQDHRRIKQRIRPMLGFKRFETAAITISGIELAEKIRKHQFNTGKLPGRPKTIPDIWAAMLAA
jgi:transposase-like protein